jgi:hypothetical protein
MHIHLAPRVPYSRCGFKKYTHVESMCILAITLSRALTTTSMFSHLKHIFGLRTCSDVMGLDMKLMITTTKTKHLKETTNE